ncbi:MAG TPA: hypothetical protein VEZ40_10145 [Pyrinomonadaceae bacterium]|nr:hypothetical protein [Pyrinomonadaceae bacterium]
MDERKFRKALALLQAIADQLPDEGIEEKFVALYHTSLTNIQNETGHDLADFFIPESELHRIRVLTGSQTRFGGFETAPSSERYCDRDLFLIKIKGAMHYVNSWVIHPSEPLIQSAKTE